MARITDPILAELDQEAATTLRVLERVPGDKLGWKPHARSMSLGQLALHVATTPGGVARVLSQDSLESTEFDRPAPASAAELIPALEDSVNAAKRFLSELNDQKAMAAWRLTKDGKVLFEAPRIAVIRSIMLNHWYHHRGQLSVYLRLLNVPVPSIYGPSADENPFA
ncbi:MAG: DinB family protein [Acidobacteria bacterium]|nr:DinB family protein [Acidobacteriota bacterium]